MARFWYCGCDHQQRQLTLLLTGLDNAGKTSVLNCLIGKPDIVTNIRILFCGCQASRLSAAHL